MKPIHLNESQEYHFNSQDVFLEFWRNTLSKDFIHVVADTHYYIGTQTHVTFTCPLFPSALTLPFSPLFHGPNSSIWRLTEQTAHYRALQSIIPAARTPSLLDGIIEFEDFTPFEPSLSAPKQDHVLIRNTEMKAGATEVNLRHGGYTCTEDVPCVIRAHQSGWSILSWSDQKKLQSALASLKNELEKKSKDEPVSQAERPVFFPDLDNTSLNYPSQAELRTMAKSLGKNLAFLVTSDETVTPATPRRIRINVPNIQPSDPIDVILSPGPQNKIVVQLQNGALFLENARRLYRATSNTQAVKVEISEDAPPILDFTMLRFADRGALEKAQTDISTIGAVLAKSDEGVSPGSRRDIRFESGGITPSISASVILNPGAPGTIIVQFEKPETLTKLVSFFDTDSSKGTSQPRSPQDEETTKYRRSPGPEGDASIESGSEEATIQPPILEGNLLRFETAFDFHAVSGQLQSGAPLLAKTSTDAPSSNIIQLCFIIEGKALGSLIESEIAPAGNDYVALSFKDSEAIKEIHRQTEPRGRLRATVTGAFKRPFLNTEDGQESATGNVAPAGEFQNPMTPADFLKTPLVRPPNRQELETPSVPIILRCAMAMPDDTKVTISIEGQPDYWFVIYGKKEIITNGNLATLARSVAKPKGEYRIETFTDQPPRSSSQSSPLKFMTELLRVLIGKHPYESLQEVIGQNIKQCPYPNKRGTRLTEVLAFSGTQMRLIKSRMDGRTPLEELLGHPSGSRIVWEALFLLLAFEGIDWKAPPKKKRNTTRKIPQAEIFWSDLQGKNHFEALGLHWSAAPRKIAFAFENFKKLYGPGGKFEKANPDLCSKIWVRLVKAHQVLEKAETRRAYRKENYSLQWSQQADLMINHAKLAIYRGEFLETRDILEVVKDIYPHSELKEVAKQLEQAIEESQRS